MTSITIIEPISDERVEAEYKKYTHLVSPPENAKIYYILLHNGNNDPSAKDIVDIARFKRWEVVALCGYRWIPDDDPEKYDACQVCMDVAGMHMRNEGE